MEELTSDPDVLEAAKLVPMGLKWSVGTGLKASHAQILPDGLRGRRHSFYAVAPTESEALRNAAQQARDFIAEQSRRHSQ